MASSSKDTTTPVTQGRAGFLKRGEPEVWGTGAALALVLTLTFTMIFVVLVNGMGVFWPDELQQVELQSGEKVLGELRARDLDKDTGTRQVQYKIANRDVYGFDFRWMNEEDIVGSSYPENVVAFERVEYGDFYGFIDALTLTEAVDVPSEPTFDNFYVAWEYVRSFDDELDAYDDQFRTLNIELERVRREAQSAAKDAGVDVTETEREQEIVAEVSRLAEEREDLIRELEPNVVTMRTADDRTKEIPLIEVLRVWRPNQMSTGQRASFYLAKIWELLSAEPRESNTEGGLFPAIFGTIMLVFLMSMFSFPLGVVAGIYLREYAKEGLLVRLVRIGVNNLAGIPSIVYGIFGLGFFVYGIGGSIDALFFPDRLPTPTFGTGGLLWASATLGLLTVPVVVVATDEALGSIPAGVREGSLALGATKFQTLYRVLLQMASPGIMTGFILAMARAAGEVAPLMITGVVKLAPSLPIDGTWPFFHFERKFMHLGFHIYDIGFQSPNVEAAKPMVFVTATLLVGIVLLMSSGAIYMRNQMKKRYTVEEF